MIASPSRAQAHLPAPLITGLALLAAVVVGRLISGGSAALGVALVVAVAFVFVVFVDISLAIAAWVVVLFIASLTVVSVGPTAMALLLLLAWLGAGGTRRGRLPALRDHRGLVIALVSFGSWLTLSAMWATRQASAVDEASTWWIAILVMILVASSLTKSRDVAYVALGFVVGGALAVIVGFLGLGDSASAASEAGRLEAGGDPNYQAAAFLAAMFIAGGLMSVFRRISVRIALLSALSLVAVGFFATESRGALIALAVALPAALVLFRRQRAQVASLIVAGSAAAAVWLFVHPEALQRLTTIGGGGSGREDVWTVGWRVFRDHPVGGVGLGNFRVVEARYVLEPGGLTHVRYISETPKVVHNSYLGLLVETGLVGLLGYAVVAALCLRAGWRAAREFDARGEFGLGNLARAVLVATIGMLAAMFFISNGYDLRLWVLFGCALVLHSLALRTPARDRPRPREPGSRSSALR